MGYGLTQTSGNKNVIVLYDDSGVQVAGYSYGPFGQLLSASGPLAQINPLRFSSEYFDDETNLVYYNYRYYSPRLGRWLSRDPIGESGGLNLYGMLGNDAVNSWDRLGWWGADIHNAATQRWAIMLKYTEHSAAAIGAADEAVDDKLGGIGPYPAVGDQGYHFNRSFGGEDSRLAYYLKHLTQAVDYCIRYNAKRDHLKAAEELGTALHPWQDWVAHGDYGLIEHPYVITPHNYYSTQDEFGSAWTYPDRPDLDVVESPNGRAIYPFLKEGHFVIGGPRPGGEIVEVDQVYDYAKYERGTKRYKLTKEKTDETLNGFKNFLEGNLASLECKCYFLGRNYGGNL